MNIAILTDSRTGSILASDGVLSYMGPEIGNAELTLQERGTKIKKYQNSLMGCYKVSDISLVIPKNGEIADYSCNGVAFRVIDYDDGDLTISAECRGFGDGKCHPDSKEITFSYQYKYSEHNGLLELRFEPDSSLTSSVFRQERGKFILR